MGFSIQFVLKRYCLSNSHLLLGCWWIFFSISEIEKSNVVCDISAMSLTYTSSSLRFTNILHKQCLNGNERNAKTCFAKHLQSFESGSQTHVQTSGNSLLEFFVFKGVCLFRYFNRPLVFCKSKSHFFHNNDFYRDCPDVYSLLQIWKLTTSHDFFLKGLLYSK